MTILHETEKWLVIDKPAGLSVHNEAPNVLSLLKEKHPRTDFHLAHRLDQETSGLLLIAKDAKYAALLMEAMAQDSTTKKYQAILRGKMKTPSATWTWALTDKAEGRKNPQGTSRDRKPCTTRVQALETSDYFSLVECEILTGRQHQIRKHAALANHAIVGDSRYNDPKYNARMAGIYGVERMCLHAYELQITIDQKAWGFKSPTPVEFHRLVSK